MTTPSPYRKTSLLYQPEIKLLPKGQAVLAYTKPQKKSARFERICLWKDKAFQLQNNYNPMQLYEYKPL